MSSYTKTEYQAAIKSALKEKTGIPFAVNKIRKLYRIGATAKRRVNGKLPDMDRDALREVFKLDAGDWDYLYLTEKDAEKFIGKTAKPESGSDDNVDASHTAVETEDFLKTKFEVRSTGRVLREMIGSETMPGQISMILTGKPSGGKSTLALLIAEDGTFDHPLLVAAEEGVSQSLRDRLERVGAKKIKITTARDEKTLLDVIRKEKADFVIFDSMTALGWDSDMVKKMLRSGASVCGILQSTKDGSFRGGQDWQHNVGLFVFVEDGRWDVVKSWYGELRQGRVDPAKETVTRTGGSSSEYYDADVESLSVDPERFQYKMKVDSAGVTSDRRKFNDLLYDPISVWKDGDKTWVVNGHHRIQWAKDSGIKSLVVRRIDAKDANEAKAIGALQNIASGQGSALDAAKFLRETLKTAAELAELGIPLSQTKLSDSEGLAGLSDDLFDETLKGKLTEKQGAVIGGAGLSADDQTRVRKMMRELAAANRPLTIERLKMVCDDFRDAPDFMRTEDTLFGSESWREKAYAEWIDVCDGVRSQLRSRKKALAVAAKHKDIIESVSGNAINKSETAEEGKDANSFVMWFDANKRRGAIYDRLRASALELADKPKDRTRILKAAVADMIAAFDEYMTGGVWLDKKPVIPADLDGVAVIPDSPVKYKRHKTPLYKIDGTQVPAKGKTYAKKRSRKPKKERDAVGLSATIDRLDRLTVASKS